MKKLITIISILFSMSFSWGNDSFQTDFLKREGLTITQLNYKWSGFNNVNHSISFNLDKSELRDSYVDFKKPNKRDAFVYILEFMKNDVNVINKNQNRFKIELLDNETDYTFSYKVNGDISNHEMAKITNALDNRQNVHMKNFFKRNYFIWNESSELISIDYLRLSDLYTPKMSSVANAFKIKNNKDVYNRRLVINDVLSFYQSIPYDTLEENRGEGFSTPLKFLDENKGDCDTKLVAINATLKSIYPDIKTIAIVLPNHVLLGVSIEPKNTDKKISVGGVTYVLSETAGPALIPLGVIDPRNTTVIKSRNYSIISL